MSTRRFAVDSRGKKIYINDCVLFENKEYYIEDIKYLIWNRDQYLTLVDTRNKNKKIDFISPNDIRPARKRTKR
jgi:Uma2 family endonuclease